LFGRAGAGGDEEDWVGGLTLAQNNSPDVADHPRIIYPSRGQRIWVPSAAAVLPQLIFASGALTQTPSPSPGDSKLYLASGEMIARLAPQVGDRRLTLESGQLVAYPT
jgi:hypothetical protein